jgi:hypothetical protein
MQNIDDYDNEVSSAYDKGKLQSVATKSGLVKVRAAARGTPLKDRVHPQPPRTGAGKRRPTSAS